MKSLIVLALLNSALAAEPVRNAAFLGQIVAAKSSISPGETIDLAIHIKHDPGFHTYWKAPGIVGVPTAMEWAETPDLKPSDILWPQPQRVKMGPYWAYGYEGECYLVVPVTASTDAKVGTLANLKGQISFMVCPAVVTEDAGCHPGFVDLSIALPVSEKPGTDTRWSKPIKAARATFAIDNTIWNPSAERDGEEISLTLKPKPDPQSPAPERIHFYSSDGQIHSDEEQLVKRNRAGLITIRMKRSEFAPKAATSLKGILYTETGLPDGSGAKPVYIDIPYPVK